jgi:pilus assembly protein Flp/PilA
MHSINSAADIARAAYIKSQSGVTAVEYGLIASLVAVAIVAAVTLLGGNLQGVFNYIAGQIHTPS